MRYHAIRIIGRHFEMVKEITKDSDFDWETAHNCWLLVPEDGSKHFVLNDYSFRSRFPSAPRTTLIQTVSD